MRIIATLISILYYGILLAQTPGPNELYKKIANYYQQNPDRLEYIQNINKNVFRYDTISSHFAYLPLGEKGFYLFDLDSSYAVTGGILLSDEYYVVNANSPEKILTKKKYIDSKFQYVPVRHCNNIVNLTMRFGNIKSIILKGNKYIAVTTKSILEIDTLTFRITKLSETVQYKKEYHQYNEFNYLDLQDSIQNSIMEQALTLVKAAKDFPVVTFKDLNERKLPSENFEGKPFTFKDLVSFNKGSLNSYMKGKYVIIDFFYQACLPCHKMTGYILDWLPTVDSSKIVLIGINPADSEISMRTEMEKRNINYPIVIGQYAEDISKKYVRGYPTLLLISPDGIIQILHFGMSKSFLSKVEKIISQ
ncbi:MAG TPA: TlpA disulfide reductase family protein [Chitinophagaceae bacterium]|jgi:thiol-disulfide isomerase/thioredoxin|nr:TlpA disulfide reductase family protein [Chitinophagaceae bacterium]